MSCALPAGEPDLRRVDVSGLLAGTVPVVALAAWGIGRAVAARLAAAGSAVELADVERRALRATLEIERLAHQAALPANVGILVQDEALYLAQVQSEGPFAINLRPGTRTPATCSHRTADLEDFHSWSAVRSSYPRP